MKKEKIDVGKMPEFDAKLSRWEVDHLVELLNKEKFLLDEDETRILAGGLRDRLRELTEPTLPGFAEGKDHDS